MTSRITVVAKIASPNTSFQDFEVSTRNAILVIAVDANIGPVHLRRRNDRALVIVHQPPRRTPGRHRAFKPEPRIVHPRRRSMRIAPPGPLASRFSEV